MTLLCTGRALAEAFSSRCTFTIFAIFSNFAGSFDRDQLVKKRLVERQLTYLMISMRQKLLAIPGKLYSRLGEESFSREAAQETKKFIHEALKELAKLPECVEADWFDRLKEEK